MKVRIISRSDIDGWILGKIARKLRDGLIKAGVEANIAEFPDPAADINHYMIYLTYDQNKRTSWDTFLITHIDNLEKLNIIKKQMEYAQLGICMSEGTMKLLLDAGINPDKLSYVNPAHDQAISIKKINIGLATALYADGRKREQFLFKLSEKIEPAIFRFSIMGSGWEEIVQQMQTKGFQVDYYPNFDYDKYISLVPEFDYYLYMGEDEGSMGFVDALSAGVKTIVTPQGYHLDAVNGITHAFTSFAELEDVFRKIAAEKKELIQSVSNWTWDHYAIKHLELWRYLLYKDTNGAGYKDGLQSMINKGAGTSTFRKLLTKYKIYALTVNRFIHSKDKMGKIKRKINRGA